MPKGQWPRGVTPHPRSGAAAESARLQRHRNGQEELPQVQGQGGDQRSYPVSEVRGGSQEEIPHAPGQSPGAAGGRSNPTPLSLRSGAAAGRSNPTSKEPWLRRCRRAQRSYPTLKVRKGSGVEIALNQSKEQRLRFAGAAMMRYPTPKVRETQVRQQVLQERIRGQTY